MKKMLFATCLLFLLLGCGNKLYKMPTENMSPTIKVGDTVIADESYYSKNSILRFDIVVFMNPEMSERASESKDTRYIKRIIALPGETIEIREGKVLINGQILNEPFKIIPDKDKDFEKITIPQNEYFLLGDNRPNSFDSRWWKKPTLDKSLILGKVIDIKHE